MQKVMPDRVFDVAIAEQHAVTFSAGMAAEGMIPFCHIYSTFLQRGYDQVIHDVALQKLPVVFCIDRAGLVGADGPTHHGAFDLAYLNPIPNIVIAAPMHEHDMRDMMCTATLYDKGPFAIRFPRGSGKFVHWKNPLKKISLGKGVCLSKGEELAVLTLGKAGLIAESAVEQLKSEGIQVAHYDMRFLKPLDTNLLHEIGVKYSKIITIEDGVVKGGFGSAVTDFLIENKYTLEIKKLGIPDQFIEHGTPDELIEECGYDAKTIIATVKRMLKIQEQEDQFKNQA